jgi:hypothetical protein
VATSAISAAARTGWLRPSLVHRQFATAVVMVVKCIHGLLGVRFTSHLDKGESARAAGRLVAHDAYRIDRASLREELLQILFGGLVREIPNVKLSIHETDTPEGVACILRSALRTEMETLPGSHLLRLY